MALVVMRCATTPQRIRPHVLILKIKVLDDALKAAEAVAAEYAAEDEEGQVRAKIVALTKQVEDAASDRVVALFRGMRARARVADQIRLRRESVLLQDWGALNVQKIWRQFAAKKRMLARKERKQFQQDHRRVLAMASKAGVARPNLRRLQVALHHSYWLLLLPPRKQVLTGPLLPLLLLAGLLHNHSSL